MNTNNDVISVFRPSLVNHAKERTEAPLFNALVNLWLVDYPTTYDLIKDGGRDRAKPRLYEYT